MSSLTPGWNTQTLWGQGRDRGKREDGKRKVMWGRSRDKRQAMLGYEVEIRDK